MFKNDLAVQFPRLDEFSFCECANSNYSLHIIVYLVAQQFSESYINCCANYFQMRRINDRGSGRTSLGSESPRVSVSKPNHMRDTINGQRATIAKLFEQGTYLKPSLYFLYF
jgi:hypothetical protein